MQLNNRIKKLETSIARIAASDVCRCEAKHYAAQNVREFLGEFFLGNCLQCDLLNTPARYSWSRMVVDAESGIDYSRFAPGEWERINSSEENE